MPACDRRRVRTSRPVRSCLPKCRFLRAEVSVLARRGVSSCELSWTANHACPQARFRVSGLSVVAVSVSGMSQLISPLRHPVVACVDALEELLDGVADLDPGYLSTADKADVLVRLTTLVDRVEGLRLRVMAASMDVADVEGATSVAAWLAPRTQNTTRSLHGREQLARGMDRRWQIVGAGVAAGTVSLAQAEVIVRAWKPSTPRPWGNGWTGNCWRKQ